MSDWRTGSSTAEGGLCAAREMQLAVDQPRSPRSIVGQTRTRSTQTGVLERERGTLPPWDEHTKSQCEESSGLQLWEEAKSRHSLGPIKRTSCIWIDCDLLVAGTRLRGDRGPGAFTDRPIRATSSPSSVTRCWLARGWNTKLTERCPAVRDSFRCR